MRRSTGRVLALAGALLVALLPAATAQAAGQGAMHGTLVDANGVGMQGIQVVILDANDEVEGFPFTGLGGVWDWSPLLAGQYRVEFMVGTNSQWAYGQSSKATATLIDVVDGQTTIVNDTYRPSSVGHLQGTVTDAVTGAGIPGVCVSIGVVGSQSSARTDLGCTDDQGSYDSTAAPGTYDVQFVDPTGDHAVSWYGSSTEAGAVPVTVTAGTTASGVDNAMTPAGHIAGTAWDLQTDSPAPRTCFVVYDGRTNVEAWDTGTGCSDDQGHFDLGSLPTGSYTVLAIQGEGSGTETDWWLYGSADQSTAALISVTAGQVTTTQRVDVGGSTGPTTGTITGTVTDRTTHVPLANVCVGLGIYSFRTGQDSSGDARSCTDANGHYTLADVPVGPQHLEFVDPTGRHALSWLGGRNRAVSAAVTVTAGGTVTADQTLARAAIVTGSVRVPAGDAVLSWHVDLFDPTTGDPVGIGTLDASGHWYATGLPARGVTVELSDTLTSATQWWHRQTSAATATVVTTFAGKRHPGIAFVVR
jgi:hypothetical protein